MSADTQLILGMLSPIYIIGGWMLKIMYDTRTDIGNVKADINAKFGEIKAEIVEVKGELKAINRRLDRLESPIVQTR